MAKTDMPEKGGILQIAPPFQESKSFTIIPHIPGGITTPEFLRKIVDVAEKHQVKAIKLTSGQQIAIMGVHQNNLDEIWQDLEMEPNHAIGLCVKSVKICPGSTYCKRGLQDSISLGLKLDELYYGMATPGNMKIAVSGCANSCAESNFRDIGITSSTKGFTIMVGGNGGAKPRIAQVIAQNLKSDQVLEKIEKMIRFYSEKADKKERLGKFIDRIGMEEFMKQIEIL
jgi:NAD(P)H-nitrite reductase large subunit